MGTGSKRSLLAVAGAVAVALVLMPSSALSLAWMAHAAAKADTSVNRAVIAPTAAQRRLVAQLGAHAAWDRYGTPSSLIKLNGYLATGLTGSPVDEAKSFLSTNGALFKLSSADNLQLVNDVTLRGTSAHAILFAQKFGPLVADWNGLIAVGVVGDKVAYVSSSAAGGDGLSGSVKLSATDAWSIAAKNAGISAGAPGALTEKDGWTYFDVPGLTSVATFGAQKSFAVGLPTPPALPALPALPGLPTSGGSSLLPGLQDAIGNALGNGSGSTGSTGTGGTGATQPVQASAPVSVGVHQGAKLVAFPTVSEGVRPAWFVNVVDLRSVTPKAYQIMVDADTGAILMRHNAVQELAQDTPQTAYTFTADYGPPPACGPVHSFAVGSGQKAIAAAASAVNPSNDIILSLINPSGNVVANSDVATSPEAVAYQPAGGADVAAGNWGLQVCPFNGPSLQPPVPNQTPPFTYVAGVVISSAGATAPTLPRPKPPTLVTNNPRWAFFPSFPAIDYSNTPQSEGCWQNTNDGIAQPKGCDQTFANPYSPFGWDVIPRTNQATQTTRGNNAFTAEAWLSPLTPAEQRSPVSTERYYDRTFPGGNFTWTNSWNQSKCDPSVLTDPTRNYGDIDAAATNLFVMHNRMHDFAYALGFTEQTYNAQLDNLDQTGGTGPYPVGREGDPELGDAQAGAVTGGQPSLEGRDNANQITLNDGTPPITNQYLWQPLASAFYAPCADGSFDLSVAGHEYTHLISNRMVGGPDASLSSAQGGAMGEAWSDLDALEFLHEYGLAGARGEEPWSLGAYVTGNKVKGIRDYNLDHNPLNYSDVGFDTTGPEVHADGEIWNGVNYELRSALVAKYGEGDLATNISCAKGETPVTQCPGGRRWIQLVYDAWLLEQGDLSMVDARDAMLAADLMRFGGADETELWNAFAKRGLGIGASSVTGDDPQPTPSFESPNTANARVSFVTVAADGANAGQAVAANIFVGEYEARVTPIADTDSTTGLGNTAAFVPASYDFVVQAPGYGIVKFSRTLDAGAQTMTIALPTNWASSVNDATASGDGVNLGKLIDDNENTNWASLSGAVAGKEVTVTLAGRHVLDAVRVSGLNHPSTCDGAAEEQGNCVGGSGSDPDNTAQNRFTALRSFTLQACDSSVSNCSKNKNWVTAFDSPSDAFPAVRPRPVAPDENLRTFDFPGVAATMVRFVVKTNQCTGGPDFQGRQDNDPSNNSDCQSTANATKVRAAELEVVSSAPSITTSAGTTPFSTTPVAGSTAGSGTSTQPASAPAVTVIGTRPASSPSESTTAGTASESSGSTAATSGVSGVAIAFQRLFAKGALRAHSSRMLATFSVAISAAKGGSLEFSDPSHGLRFRSTRIATVLVDYMKSTATVTGFGRVGANLVRFNLQVANRLHDTFALRLSSGYRLSGTLVRGSVNF